MADIPMADIPMADIPSVHLILFHIQLVLSEVEKDKQTNKENETLVISSSIFESQGKINLHHYTFTTSLSATFSFAAMCIAFFSTHS